MDAFLLSIITPDFEYSYSLQSQMNETPEYSLLSHTALIRILTIATHLDALIYSIFLVNLLSCFGCE